MLLLGSVAAEGRIGQRLVGALRLAAQPLLLAPHFGGFGLKRFGVAATDVQRGLVLAGPHPLGGDRHGGGNPFAEAGQGVPLFLRRIEVRGCGAEVPFGGLFRRLRIDDGPFSVGSGCLGGGLVGQLRRELGLGHGQVVG